MQATQIVFENDSYIFCDEVLRNDTSLGQDRKSKRYLSVSKHLNFYFSRIIPK